MKLSVGTMQAIRLLICICGAVVLQIRPVFSQDEVFPIVELDGEQIDPSIAYHSETNEMMITWVNVQGRQFDIFAKGLDQDGNPQGNAIPIDVTLERQSNPAIVTREGTSEYFITWQSASNAGMDNFILGKVVDGNNIPSDEPIAVSIRPGRQSNPSLGYCNTDDSYLAIWAEDVDSQSPWLFYILGQQVLGSGIVAGDVITVSADFPSPNGGEIAAFQQFDADIVYNPVQNEFFSVFRDARFRHNGSGSNDDIFGQRLRCDGSPVLTDDIPISLQFSQPPGGNQQNKPSVAYDSQHNQYLVVWQDGRNEIDTADPGVLLDVYGQLVAADGELVNTDEETNFPISLAAGNQENVDLAYSPEANVYLVVWQDNRGTDADIYGQFVSAQGDLIGEEIVIRNSSGIQQDPAVLYDTAKNKFLVVWSEQSDLYGRWILPTTPPGSPQLPEHSLIVGEATITGPSSHHEIYVNLAERHQTIVRTGSGNFSQWVYELTNGEILTNISESEYISKVNELFVDGCGESGCEIVTVVEIQDAQNGQGVEAASIEHRRQSWFSSLTTTSINPPQPQPEDSIQITMSGEWWNSCTPEYESHQIAGETISIQVVMPELEPTGTACTQLVTPWSFLIDIGQLPRGQYAVSAMNSTKTFMVGDPIFYVFIPIFVKNAPFSAQDN